MKKIIVLLITILLQVSQAVKIKSESKAVKHFTDFLLQIGQRTQIKSRGKDHEKYQYGDQIDYFYPDCGWITLEEAQNQISDYITNVTNNVADFPPQGLPIDQLYLYPDLFVGRDTQLPILCRLSYEQLKEYLLLQNQQVNSTQNYMKSSEFSAGMITKQFIEAYVGLEKEILQKLLSFSQSLPEPMTMTLLTAETILAKLAIYFNNSLKNIPPQGYSSDAWLQIVIQNQEINNNAARQILISQTQKNQYAFPYQNAIFSKITQPLKDSDINRKLTQFLNWDLTNVEILTKQQQQIALKFLSEYYSLISYNYQDIGAYGGVNIYARRY